MRKENGFGLLEMMLVLGLMGLASVYFMRMMANQQKQSKTINSTNEIENALLEVRALLQNPNTCVYTFGNLDLDLTKELGSKKLISIDKVMWTSEMPRIVVGKKIRGTSVSVKKMELKELTPSVDDPRLFTGEIQITFDKGIETYSSELVKAIPLEFYTNELNEVTSCGMAGVAKMVAPFTQQIEKVGPNKSELNLKANTENDIMAKGNELLNQIQKQSEQLKQWQKKFDQSDLEQ